MPLLAQSAQDPFAETAQEVVVPQEQPVEATEASSTTGVETGVAVDVEAAATVDPETGTPADVNADATADAETADAETADVDTADVDTADVEIDADTDSNPGGEEDPFSDESVSGLEDEYGFDPADEFASEQEPEQRDPWEGFNRAVFSFNDTADRWVLKPVAVSYRQIMPIFMQTGIGNFFSNLREITNSTNSVLQWKWGQASNDAGRFMINSTVGVVGLFDVAQHMGLEPSDGEDFGQTLAVWGVPSGPYVVLPLLGASTVRDTPAKVVDYYTDPVSYVDHTATRNSLYFSDMVQQRASLLQAETLLQGDRYTLLRDAYLQRREYLINDGELEDDFGGDLDDYEF